jgi:hypothetical protein
MLQSGQDETNTTNSSNSLKQLCRRHSLPDIKRLKEEWDKREAIQTTAKLAPGKLQAIKYKNREFLLANHINRLIYLMLKVMCQFQGHLCDLEWVHNNTFLLDQNMQMVTGTKGFYLLYHFIINCLI